MTTAGVIAVLASGAAGKTATGVVEIPFEYYKNEVLVQVRVNGQGPFTMMVDTGTDPSAIDLATAKQIGLKLSLQGRPSSGGGTGVSIAYKCRFDELLVGELRAKGVDAAAIDLTKISERMGRHVDGVLGHSFLNRRIVQFDYPARKLRFFKAIPVPRTGVRGVINVLPPSRDDSVMSIYPVHGFAPVALFYCPLRGLDSEMTAARKLVKATAPQPSSSFAQMGKGAPIRLAGMGGPLICIIRYAACSLDHQGFIDPFYSGPGLLRGR